MTNESNYRESEQSVRGLSSFEQAEALRELMQRDLDTSGRDEDTRLHIDTRGDGLFDLIVLVRVN